MAGLLLAQVPVPSDGPPGLLTMAPAWITAFWESTLHLHGYSSSPQSTFLSPEPVKCGSEKVATKAISGTDCLLAALPACGGSAHNRMVVSFLGQASNFYSFLPLCLSGWGILMVTLAFRVALLNEPVTFSLTSFHASSC